MPESNSGGEILGETRAAQKKRIKLNSLSFTTSGQSGLARDEKQTRQPRTTKEKISEKGTGFRKEEQKKALRTSLSGLWTVP